MEAKIKDQAKCNLKKGNTALLLMMVQKSGGYQLRLVVYPIIYDGFDTSQVVVWDFWTINSRFYYLLAGETGVSMGSTNRFNLNPQLVVKKHIAWMSGKIVKDMVARLLNHLRNIQWAKRDTTEN